MNTPVNFELAKLLKEKGFDKITQNLWQFNGANCEKIPNKNSENLGFSAPTIADVCMWLYEKHEIWIYSYSVAPFVLDEEDYPKIVFVSKVQKFKEFDRFIDTDNGLAVNHCHTPTEAYEAAIEYTLKNLI